MKRAFYFLVNAIAICGCAKAPSYRGTFEGKAVPITLRNAKQTMSVTGVTIQLTPLVHPAFGGGFGAPYVLVDKKRSPYSANQLAGNYLRVEGTVTRLLPIEPTGDHLIPSDLDPYTVPSIVIVDPPIQIIRK